MQEAPEPQTDGALVRTGQDLQPAQVRSPRYSRRPKVSRRSAMDRYGIACLAVAVATVIRLVLHPALRDTAPFPFYFFGVVFVAWYVGLGPALLAVILGAAAGDYFFIPPEHSFRILHAADKRNVSAFIAVGIIVSLISDSQRRARERAEEARATAEQEAAQRRQAEEALRRQQAEIEALNARLQRAMAETHHRVKNNLQVITAMVELQAVESGDSVPAEALTRISQHVQALAGIHDMLTQQVQIRGDVELLDAGAVIHKLRPLLEGLVGDRSLRFTIDELPVPIHQGTNLAILVNELVSNGVKHGEGEIELSLAVIDGHGFLQVRDQGPGFPPDFDPQAAAHTGLELIESLSRWDLKGELSYRNHPDGGALITVTFPLTSNV